LYPKVYHTSAILFSRLVWNVLFIVCMFWLLGSYRLIDPGDTCCTAAAMSTTVLLPLLPATVFIYLFTICLFIIRFIHSLSSSQ